MSNTQTFSPQFSPIMRSPLCHFDLPAQATAANDTKGVWANEIALLGYISVRGNAGDKAFAKAFLKATSLALPIEPCSMAAKDLSGKNQTRVFWLSPDEWLIACAREQHAELMEKLQQALQGMHAQVVDNSGTYTTVLLLGKQASAVLQHCTVYDIHALKQDHVVGTTFGKSSVILHRSGENYMLVFRRSFADYIWRYLTHNAAPYGFGVAALGE